MAGRNTSSPDVDRKALWRARLRPACLGLATALVVVAPLVTSERTELTGAYLPQVMLWLLLAMVWGAAGCWLGGLRFRFDRIDACLLTLVVISGLSGWVMLSYGAPRPTINGTWTWVGLGVSFFLLRQLLQSQAEARALCATMLAVAVLLSVSGIYEVFVTQPQARQLYQHAPEEALRRAGVVAPPGSIARAHFENRLNSGEPTATFSLTNSLAGFLAPWLTLAVGVGLPSLLAQHQTKPVPTKQGKKMHQQVNKKRASAATWLALAVVLVLAATCLALTKSRTAWLATLAGMAALALTYSGIAPKWKFRLAWGFGGACLLLVLIFAGLTAADPTIVSTAGASVVYRLEYWQSTAGMIADYPLLGVGPGNFQEFYTAYKLPQASESIADPHNFVMEIAVTLGTPALGVWVATVALAVARAIRSEFATRSDADSKYPTRAMSAASISSAFPWSVYLGFGIGCLLAIPLSALAGFPINLVALTLGIPMAAVVLLGATGWIRAGELPRWIPLVAVGVCLLNLLAAGGVSFPGVAITLWVLLAVVNLHPAEVQQLAAPRWPWIALAVVAAGLFFLCRQTGYQADLESRGLLALAAQSQAEGNQQQATEAMQAASLADRWSWTSQMQLAQLHQERLLNSSPEQGIDPDQLKRFEKHAAAALTLNPRAHRVHEAIGYLYLELFVKFSDKQHLEESVRLLRRSVELYPNNSMGHLQLAWALKLAGQGGAARQAADQALRLDSLNPHQERQLSQRKAFGESTNLQQQQRMPALLMQLDGEQLAQRLRKTSSPE